MRHQVPSGAEYHVLPDLSRCLIREAAKLSLSGDAAVIRESWLNPERFCVLFDTYFAEIYRYVARRLGCRAADELAAKVFLIAFNQRHRYDLTQMSARPWLYGIATNVVGRCRRHEVARYRALAQGAAGLAGFPADQSASQVAPATGASLPGQASALSQTRCQDRRRRVAHALALLRSGERDVLMHAALAGLSHEEIAMAIGVPRPVVDSLLCRLRRKFRLASSEPAVISAGQSSSMDELLLLVLDALPKPSGPAPWVVADAWAVLTAPRGRTGGQRRLGPAGAAARARGVFRLGIPRR